MRFLLVTISLIVFFSCTGKEKESKISFYHWKSKIEIDEKTGSYLDSLDVKKIYFRFFDVHWNKDHNHVIPIGILQWQNFEIGRALEIIPVIYITNIALLKTEYDRGVDSLALNISKKIKLMLRQRDSVRFSINELQLDCDWSMETQAKFFRLINLLKVYLPNIKTFSSTIRLHQVKYFTTTGVPPVDYGVLMFYNMGDITNPSEKNSILNLETAKKYLLNFDTYPLKLDIALPLFSWAVQFRDNKVIQLINDLSHAELLSNNNFKKIKENEYKVLKSTYIKGIYVYKNDLLRIESPGIKDLKNSKKLLNKAFGNRNNYNLIFYHLDNYIVEEFDYKTLKSIAKH